MKPRRYEIGTPEDLEIWSRFNQRQMSKIRLPDFGRISIAADRRDADLMLHFKTAYGDIMGPGYLHYRVWHAACAFQGIPHPPEWQV